MLKNYPLLHLKKMLDNLMNYLKKENVTMNNNTSLRNALKQPNLTGNDGHLGFFPREDKMVQSFFDGAQILCNHLLGKEGHIGNDSVIYPFLNSAYHHLELQLKIIIKNCVFYFLREECTEKDEAAGFLKFIDKNRVMKNHSIKDLWTLFKENLKKILNEDGENHKEFFHEIDQHDEFVLFLSNFENGFAFRYAADKELYRYIDFDYINIELFWDNFYSLHLILDGIDSYISDRIENITGCIFSFESPRNKSNE